MCEYFIDRDDAVASDGTEKWCNDGLVGDGNHKFSSPKDQKKPNKAQWILFDVILMMLVNLHCERPVWFLRAAIDKSHLDRIQNDEMTKPFTITITS